MTTLAVPERNPFLRDRQLELKHGAHAVEHAVRLAWTNNIWMGAGRTEPFVVCRNHGITESDERKGEQVVLGIVRWRARVAEAGCAMCPGNERPAAFGWFAIGLFGIDQGARSPSCEWQCQREIARGVVGLGSAGTEVAVGSGSDVGSGTGVGSGMAVAVGSGSSVAAVVAAGATVGAAAEVSGDSEDPQDVASTITAGIKTMIKRFADNRATIAIKRQRIMAAQEVAQTRATAAPVFADMSRFTAPSNRMVWMPRADGLHPSLV
ncbi:hypothetical protein GQR58_029635 [Nymphon striatum]|nr:hypothetical protein GQR58_029635 [Nymphon striatum]